MKQLVQIAPTMQTTKANQVGLLLNELAPQFGLINKDLFEEYLAQVIHESGAFSRISENMNYTAKRLLQVFPKYFNAITANQYAMQPIKIANRVYANRMGNGNESSGDGWLYRGGGCIQLTGRAMYDLYIKYTGNINAVDLVRNDMYWAIHSSLWFFCINKKLIQLSEADKFIEITKQINGGVNGLKDRQEIYERVKKYLI